MRDRLDPPHQDAPRPAAPVTPGDRLWRGAMILAHWGMRAWWMLRRPEAHGAHVAVWCEGHMLLVRNSYRRGLNVPSGGVHRGESHGEAAARELAEEVGIEVAVEALTPAADFVLDFEGKQDHVHYFELCLEAPPELRIDRREVVWAGFAPEESLLGLPILPHVRRYLELTEIGSRAEGGEMRASQPARAAGTSAARDGASGSDS